MAKRFVTEVDENGTTTLVFGNGILRNSISGSLTQGFLQTEQAGYTIPGETTGLTGDINTLLAGPNTSLGETPSNTTLTVIYRVGGGIKSNVSVGEITTITDGGIVRIKAGNTETPIVINPDPARGGSGLQDINEIRERSKAHFSTQRRCVTKEDYEARIMNLPSKYGSIAKVHVARNVIGQGDVMPTGVHTGDVAGVQGINYEKLKNLLTAVFDQRFLYDGAAPGDQEQYQTISIEPGSAIGQNLDIMVDGVTDTSANLGWIDTLQALLSAEETIPDSSIIPSVEVHLLSYNNEKILAPPPSILMENVKAHLLEHKIISDEFALYKGKVINFGVGFEVVANHTANKQDVKMRCIDIIRDYFKIDKLQFRQPIYTSDLEYELMGINGVRAIEYVELTQNFNQLSSGNSLNIQSNTFMKKFWIKKLKY